MQTKMMKLTFGTLFLVAFLGASPAYSVADESYRIKVGEGKYTPRNPPDVSFENDHWFVLPRYDDGNVDILVYDRGNQKSLINEIRLEYAWSQVNAILETPNHNLIVESLVSPVASEIAIISTARKSGSPYIDKFLTYRPKASPQSDWIVFEQFSPPHTYDQNISSCFRLYSVTSGNKVEMSDDEDIPVGELIYPRPFAAPAEDCNPFAPSGDVYKMTSDRFMWSEDGKSVIFSAATHDKLFLVAVDLSKNRKKIDRVSELLIAKKDDDICAYGCNLARVLFDSFEGNLVNYFIDNTEIAFPAERSASSLAKFSELPQN